MRKLRTSYKVLLQTLILFTASFISSNVFAQTMDTSKYITQPASLKYYQTKFYKFFWGTHYRDVWHMPVTIPKVNLDTMFGGLKPYMQGGSRQTKSIRVKDNQDREYVFRSLDKTFSGALPEIAKGTFIEKIADDQVTIAHPYAAMVVAPLADAAGIFHASPRLVYVPKQAALGTLNDATGNTAYFFEQRPDENWSIEKDFGYSKNIVSTDKMMEKTLEDNDDIVDQKSFVRARIFDMLIGDWGRHEEQWRWATFKDGKKTTYKPIPRDRDNAFSVFDGFILKRAISVANAKHMQSFDDKIKNINTLNFPARNLDRRFTNGLSLMDWVAEANYLKTNLTDAVIDDAVKQMPPEVYQISGTEIARKLKMRRDDIVDYATKYYLFLAKEVSIPLSEKNDRVEINRISDTQTAVQVFKITKDGEVKNKPYLNRVFDNRETKEIRIFGMAGEDQWNVKGKVDKSIKFRLIGGPDKDVYLDSSSIRKNGRRTIIYDNFENDITGGSETKKHLSSDSNIHDYAYKYFIPSKKGIRPSFFFSNQDRFFVGLSYIYRISEWRKTPYGQEHKIDARYSIEQKAPSFRYVNHLPQLFGKWDLRTDFNYDDILWLSFFGTGNDVLRKTDDRDFYRARSHSFDGRLGVERVFRLKSRLTINGTFRTIDVLEDKDRLIGADPAYNFKSQYSLKRFAGAEVNYLYQDINDSILPTKGFYFLGTSNFTQNLDDRTKTVLRYGLETGVFIPVGKRFDIKLKLGGSSLTGSPEFYQFNAIGSESTFRGVQSNRYSGTSALYNQNELRYVTDVRSFLYAGKFGLFGFVDNGRVFMKGEKSNTIHTSYGGGVILAPFNFAAFSVSYGVAEGESGLTFGFLKNL